MTPSLDPQLWPAPARLALAFIAGAATVPAFAPFGWSLLAVAGPALLFILWRSARPGQAFWQGWAYGMGLMGFGVFWLHISIERFGGVDLVLAVIATLLFALFMALYYGLAATLAARLAGRRGWPVDILVFAGVWVLAEWARGWVLTGFPWLALGYSQIDTPLAGYAPLLGVYGVSLTVVVTAGALVHARRVWPLLPIVLLWAGGYGLQQLDWSEPAGEPFRASLIQGNVDQDRKWRADEFFPTVELYLGLTRELADSRLVVWPETAMPAYADQVEQEYLQPLAGRLARQWRDVLLGIPIREDDGRSYNAMLNLGVSGRDAYYKRHLVPFGEFMPLRALLEPLIEVFAIPMSDFSASRSDDPSLIVAGHPAGISICYEDAFGAEVLDALPKARFLVNASNDAWFGDSLAPHQHLEIARMRARETGRYLLRATNTGISAIIGPAGELREIAPQFEQAVLTASIQPLRGQTPYVRLGNAAIVTLCLMLVAIGYGLGRRTG